MGKLSRLSHQLLKIRQPQLVYKMAYISHTANQPSVAMVLTAYNTKNSYQQKLQATRNLYKKTKRNVKAENLSL
jgi:hypothetical protein